MDDLKFFFNDLEINFIQFDEDFSDIMTAAASSPNQKVKIKAKIIKFYEEGDLILNVVIDSVKFLKNETRLFGQYVI